MAGARRQHQHVARFDADGLPGGTTQGQARFPLRYAQYFMRVGVEVVIVKYPISP